MKIAIQLDTAKQINSLNRKIRDAYPGKIAKYVLSEIILKNNDIIEFISNRTVKDITGRRADVAIGPDAEYITFDSRRDKKFGPLMICGTT